MSIARFRDIRDWQNTCAGDDYPSAGAGGNRLGVPACRPGSRLPKSDYRAPEVASGRGFESLQGRHEATRATAFPGKREYQVTIWLNVQQQLDITFLVRAYDLELLLSAEW